MIWVLKSINYYLWDVIQNGHHIPIKVDNGIIITKPSKNEMNLKKRKLN